MPPNFESDHRRAIIAEEISARSIIPENSTISATPFVVPKKQIKTQWGMVDEDLLPVDLEPKLNVQTDYDD